MNEKTIPKGASKDRSWVASAMKELGRDAKEAREIYLQKEKMNELGIDEQTQRIFLDFVKKAKKGDDEAIRQILNLVSRNLNLALFAISDPHIVVIANKNGARNGYSVGHRAASDHEECALEIIRNHPEIAKMQTESGHSVAHAATMHISARQELLKSGHKDLLELREIYGKSVKEIIETGVL